MEALYVVKHDRQRATAYTVRSFDYNKIYEPMDPGAKLYVCVKHDDVLYTLDWVRVAHDYPMLATAATWTDFNNDMDTTDLAVIHKNICVPTTVVDIDPVSKVEVRTATEYFSRTGIQGPTIHSVLHETGINASYGTITNAVRDQPMMSWAAKDIILTKEDSDIDLDFDNSLVVCNGVAVASETHEGELYARGAAPLFKEKIEVDKDVVLVDFGKLGNMTQYRFADLTVQQTIDKELRITTPTDTFKNQTVLLVIAGRMFYPWEFSLLSNELLEIDLKSIGLRYYLNDNGIKRSEGIFNTTTYMYDDIEDYLISFMGSIDDNENFIITIDNPDIMFCAYHKIMDLRTQGHKFHHFTDGLLTNTMTRVIEEYVINEYEEGRLLTSTRARDYKVIKNNDVSRANKVISIGRNNVEQITKDKRHGNDVVDLFKESINSSYTLVTMEANK